MTGKIPKFPRLSRKVYFFPALLPIAAIVPWLLTALGAVASVAVFSGGAFWRKHRLKILSVAVIFFTTAVIIPIIRMPDKVVRDQGTQATLTEELPVAQIIQPSPLPEPNPKMTKFGEIWSQRLNKQALSTPVIAGDLLIFGSYKGSIDALSLQNGAEVWSLPQKEPVFALCLEADSILYAGEGLHETTSARLTAINPTNGKPFWQREFLGRIESPPALDKKNSRLWVGTGPSGLWALNSRDGMVLWHKTIGHMASTVAISNNTIYALAQPNKKSGKSVLYALDAKKGDTIWKRSLPCMPWGNPFFDKTGKTIFTTTGMGQIGVIRSTDQGWAQALSMADGKILWQKELQGMPLQPDIYLPDINIIIYSLKTGELIALNVKDGATVWRTRVGDELQAAATLLEGKGEPLIAVTTYDGIFSIRRAATGVEVARRIVRENSTSSPVSQNDTVFVMTAYSVTAYGGVHALREGH
ncbi:MAG: PQQ-binding-like beta-propeller repeat protein [Alphaproteobacteria bacterium]|nr:PQQ-binding-like beta-propeller repeat protein [Alphaproteobacteria bacterium]